MITIQIYRRRDERIERFSVTGHAKYDDPGKDIVCAGVSAVTVGAVNAIEKLTGITPEARMKSGLLSATLPECGEASRDDQAQLLLEGMIVSLEAIAEQYSKYVRIKETLA